MGLMKHICEVMRKRNSLNRERERVSANAKALAFVREIEPYTGIGDSATERFSDRSLGTQLPQKIINQGRHLRKNLLARRQRDHVSWPHFNRCIELACRGIGQDFSNAFRADC
jgi:hypothetical protein